MTPDQFRQIVREELAHWKGELTRGSRGWHKRS